jgi:hypothetical protein
MYICASLLVKFFGLNEHIPNIYFHHIIRHKNCCVDFLVDIERSLKLSVIVWYGPHQNWTRYWGLISQVESIYSFFFYFFSFVVLLEKMVTLIHNWKWVIVQVVFILFFSFFRVKYVLRSVMDTLFQRLSKRFTLLLDETRMSLTL